MSARSEAAALLTEQVHLCREFFLEHVVAYAESPGFAQRLAEEEEACLGPVGEAFGVGNSGDPEQDAFWLAIDSMLFQAEAPKSSLATRLAKFDKNLSAVHRALLQAWTGDVPIDFFEVTAVGRDHGTLRSLGDGTTCGPVYSLLTEWESGALVRGDIVWARLLPCGGAWFPSTPLAAFPAEDRATVRQVAARPT